MSERVTADRAEWNPDDPFDAMSESFRRQVAHIASEAYRASIYRELSPVKRLESFVAGTLTGLIGVAFVSIRPEGRDEFMEALLDYLPGARQQAEEIIRSAIGEE